MMYNKMLPVVYIIGGLFIISVSGYLVLDD